MTSGPDLPTTLKPDDLRKLKLRRSLRGYERAAVDKLAQDAASGMEALTRERDELHERAGKLEGELSEYRDSQQLVRDTLISAQRAAEDLRARTQKECDEMLDAARAEGGVIEAQLGREREEAEAELARLKQQEQELRASYRVLLHAALDRLGEESAQKATGVEPSLLDALAPRRVIGEPSSAATDAVDQSTTTPLSQD